MTRSLLIVTDRPYLPDRAGGRESSMHDLASLMQWSGHRVAVLAGSHPFSTAPLTIPGNRSVAELARRLSFNAIAGRVRFYADRLTWSAPYAVLRERDVVKALIGYLRDGVYERAILNVHRPDEFVRAAGDLAHRCVVYIRDVEELDVLDERSFPADVPVVANSEFCAAAVARRIGRAVRVIEPFVERDRYLTRPTGRFVTYVNPVKVKGLELAYGIARACPEIPFLFLEGWPHSHELQRRLRELRRRSTNVTWRRRVRDMRPIYRATRVLLVPSQWQEAWGRVVVEAQFSGIPAVASRVGGLPGNVQEGGLLLGPDAPVEEWAQAVRRLWTDQAEYERRSTFARQRADAYWRTAASNALELAAFFPPGSPVPGTRSTSS